jgi:hypothetical protein
MNDALVFLSALARRTSWVAKKGRGFFAGIRVGADSAVTVSVLIAGRLSQLLKGPPVPAGGRFALCGDAVYEWWD